MSRFALKYGKSSVSVEVPDEDLKTVMVPRKLDLPPSEEEEIERALNDPIGSPKIECLLKPHMKTVIMVSDVTRPSPTRKLLPPLLRRIAACGVSDDEVTIVFGMGIHRPMSSEERAALVGPEVMSRIACVESSESGEYVFVGKTSRGTPIEVCPEVADCDFLICTGNIEYHYFAGYSGGAKAVLPGACSRSTVEANHAMQLLPGAALGSFEGNPVRQDIEEAGKKVGIDFILNVVLDEQKRIVRAVAGDVSEAHAVGRGYVDELYGVPVEGEADVVIASAGGYPKDLNLYQAQKALENASRGVKEGGTIILLAECREGLGEKSFQEYLTRYPLDEIIARIKARFVLGAHKAAALARLLMRNRVYLVSAMDPALVRSCKMVPFASAQEALREVLRVGSRPSVLVMPFGGSTVPLIRQGSLG